MSLRVVCHVLMLLAAGTLASSCHSRRPSENQGTPLMVFAAASLRDVSADLAKGFGADHDDTDIVFNFAGSNTLAQQIRAASSADVFLSADGAWVDFLDEAGRTVDGTRRPFLTNRLVVVAHADSACRVTRPADLAHADYRHLALGDPSGVPAGRYTRATLEGEPFDEDGHDNLWSAVAERVVPAPDVRAALALVESDPEILGIVYKTDVPDESSAPAPRRIRILYEFAPREEVRITYWAALIEDGERIDKARAFLDFLVSPDARAIAERHGFGAPP